MKFWMTRRFKKCAIAGGGLVGTCLVAWLIVTHGGCVARCIPDQAPFEPLSELQKDDQAFVRIYAAPVPQVKSVAVHTWFVTRRSGSTKLHRWEIWQRARGPFDHIILDGFPPERDVGAGGTFILAELLGEEAERVIDFIERESPTYPCRKEYRVFPGPNSNTYPQWVLTNTGWDVHLPWVAVGKNWTGTCREGSLPAPEHN